MGQLLCAGTLVLGVLFASPVWAQAKPPAKPQAKPPAKPQAKPAKPMADAGKKTAKRPQAQRPDFEFLTEDLILRKDGKLMWFYRTDHVWASVLAKSLKKMNIPGLTTQTRDAVVMKFNYDTRTEKINLTSPPLMTPGVDENVLILIFPPPYKDMIEEFIDRLDVPTPQVFIKAKVIEVTLDSELDIGVSMIFNRSGGDPSNPQNTNAFFRGFTSAFKPGSFTEPNSSGLSLFFDDLGEKYGVLQAEINALQARGSANILSEPNILAAQGQVATITTGTQTPIAEVTVTGGSERISTTFKETGIKLNFMPLHIGRDYVTLRMRTEVSSVTGFLTTQGQNVSVQTPIIATRNAETVVTVRDGMTMVIGGLYAVSEIDNKEGVPILGDIPVLKYLFSRTKKTKIKSELDFFVTPFIVKHRLDTGIITPPGEEERLARLRARKQGHGTNTHQDHADHEAEDE